MRRWEILTKKIVEVFDEVHERDGERERERERKRESIKCAGKMTRKRSRRTQCTSIQEAIRSTFPMESNRIPSLVEEPNRLRMARLSPVKRNPLTRRKRILILSITSAVFISSRKGN